MKAAPASPKSFAIELPTSFRDPAGQVLFSTEGVFRLVNPSAVGDLKGFLATEVAAQLFSEERLVGTRVLDSTIHQLPGQISAVRDKYPRDGLVLQHNRVFFQSFPYEWPGEMLMAAARLTLDLCRRTLMEGFGLKDASPYNVLFQGTRPIFVDLLSFERRRPGDPLWLPYAQFVRSFILPLLCLDGFKLSLSRVFLANREGLEPEELYALLSPFKRLRTPFLSLVTVPTWLGRSRKISEHVVYHRELKESKKAQYIVTSLFHRLESALDCARPGEPLNSRWSDYDKANHYQPAAERAKRHFVQRVLRDIKPVSVLDVGANSGTFSELAARRGAKVVAIDSDPAVVGALWRRSRSSDLDILPLVIDLANPSPAIGWRNAECESFLERARGKFDCVLILAVVHHLLVTARISLAEILHLVADLSTRWVVIEYIGPEDAMFRSLLRGRDALHRDLNRFTFEAGCREKFEISQSLHLPGSQRSLYLLRKK